VGLVGYGSGGASFHAPLIISIPGLRLSGICVDSESGVQRARAAHPDIPVHRSLDELLARPDVRVVVVATPNATHAQIAGRAIEAGRDVVVEKPMATSVRDARALVDAARSAGRRLAVFANRRWDGDFVALQQAVRAGRLGETLRFESRWERQRPVPPIGTWKDRPGEGGGLLWNLMPHLIDQALALLGPPRWVSARLESRRPRAIADDETWVTIGHQLGATSWLVASYLPHLVGPRFRLVGRGATYLSGEVDPSRNTKRGDPHLCEPDDVGSRLRAQGRVVDRHGSEPVAVPPDDHGALYRAIRDAVADGGPFPVTVEDAVAVVGVIEAAARSSAEGRVVTIGEERETSAS
jgi:predicted dehydrogenase